MQLLSYNVSCPYCGESIELLIDDSASGQDYYEDCSVCCRSIRIQFEIALESDSQLLLLRDDE